MKICYLADAQSIHTQRLAKHFAERGYEVHLISFKSAKIENVKVHLITPLLYIPYFSILSSSIFNIIKIKKLIKEINPDIIHGHYITEYGFCAAVSGFKPLVVSAWGSDVLIEPKKSFIKKLILKYTIRKSDIIHSVSKNLTKELISYSTDKERIITVPTGVNIEKFNPGVDGSEIRKSLRWEKDNVVISTRNFEPVYNVECLIKAMPLIIKAIPNAKFIIIGKGSLENKLKNMVKALGILNNVKFIGYVQQDKLPNYLSCADIYVSTSLSDGTSNSLLEAMSSGLPIVATDIESNKVWIENGKTGYLFGKKDYVALAKNIITLIKDKEKSKIFGEKNREIVKKEGDWNKQIKKIEKLYENLINKYGKIKLE